MLPSVSTEGQEMHFLRTVSHQQSTAFFALLVSQAILGASASIAGSPLSGAVTPPGRVNLPYAPLASQDQSSFGEAITFAPAAYTPQGIASLTRLALKTQDEMGFGYAIVFVPSAYTPPGIVALDPIDVAAIAR